MDSQCKHNLSALFAPAAKPLTTPTERALLDRVSRVAGLLDMNPAATRAVADAVDAMKADPDMLPMGFLAAIVDAAGELEARS